VADVIVKKSLKAVLKTGVNRFFMVGGVAANSYLRKRLKDALNEKGVTFFSPSIKYCGDNASMIASAGYYGLKTGRIIPVEEDITADSSYYFPFNQ